MLMKSFSVLNCWLDKKGSLNALEYKYCFDNFSIEESTHVYF